MFEQLRLIDLQEVYDCFGGNVAVVLKTITRVNEHFPAQWQELLESIESQNTQQIDVLAHRLAGSLLMVGASGFSSYLRKMSHSARDGNVPTVEMMKDSERYYDTLIREMNIILTKLDDQH